MIRKDRELLAELARLNTDMTALALRMVGGSASSAEQRHCAQRLIVAGRQLHRRAEDADRPVREGEILTNSLALPAHTVEPVHRAQRQ